MEFFFLFILNIFTGAVIYLILSLKMERTTSTFHEQKLRKEMGEIITEFNATAERNITLLENRINILKRLMGEQGTVKGIDFKIDDEVMLPKVPVEGIAKKNRVQVTNEIKNVKSESVAKKSNLIKTDADSDNNILVGFIDKISNLSKEETMPLRKADSVFMNKSEIAESNRVTPKSGMKNAGMISGYSENGNDYSEESGMVQQDIGLLFSGAGDKYALIAELYKKGYSVDDISKHSGLPSGEVRLVISLNR